MEMAVLIKAFVKCSPLSSVFLWKISTAVFCSFSHSCSQSRLQKCHIFINTGPGWNMRGFVYKRKVIIMIKNQIHWMKNASIILSVWINQCYCPHSVSQKHLETHTRGAEGWFWVYIWIIICRKILMVMTVTSLITLLCNFLWQLLNAGQQRPPVATSPKLRVSRTYLLLDNENFFLLSDLYKSDKQVDVYSGYICVHIYIYIFFLMFLSETWSV